MTVEGDVRQTGCDAFARLGTGEIATGDLDEPTHERHEAENRFAQLELAVALHAGHADDLAGVNPQRDVFEREFGSGGRAGN